MAELKRVEVPEELTVSDDEDEAQFEALMAGVVARCKASNVTIKTVHGLLYHNEYNVAIAQGRGERDVNIWYVAQASRLASIPFEKYRFIAGFAAIYSTEDDFIEASIQLTENVSSKTIEEYLFGLKPEDRKTPNYFQVTEDDGKRVSVGPASAALTLLTNRPQSAAVRIEGFAPSGHEDALKKLRRVSDALFFQLDLATGVSIGLARERQRHSNMRHSQRTARALRAFTMPQHEYDDAPVALYRYGRSAFGMPLLQFLAFYQAVEFYYPTYSDSDARRRVRMLLKDPLFRADSDAHLGRLITVLGTRSGAAFGNERVQLRATIRDCVDPEDLARFIEKSAARTEFYADKKKFAPFPKINASLKSVESLDDLATRLYDIRCAIVHSRLDGEDRQNSQRLLPFTQEADQLEHDIQLMKFVAEKVLIASSRLST